MIANATITAFGVAAIITLLVPIVILIALAIKRKISGLPLLLGAVAFFVSQIVLRMPILSALSGQEWYIALTKNFILLALFLSLSAGLFEETARLSGALLLKKRRSYKDIISFGLGHAFCEVIVLIGVSQISNLVLCMVINSGSGTLPTETLEIAIVQLTATNPAHVYWGLLERFSAVIFHLFATMLVFKGVIEKKWGYCVLAVVAHTTFNFAGVVLVKYAGIVVSESVLLVMAVAAGFYVIKQHKNQVASTQCK